jgi:NF-kappa-B-activating protein C-terminal domain
MKRRGRKREKSKRRKKRRRSPSTSSSSSNSSSHDSVSEDDQHRAQGDIKSRRTISEVNQNNEKEETNAPILDEDDWKEANDFKSAIQGLRNNDDDEEEDDEIGPMPLAQSNASSDPLHSSSYGSALLPGEGQALAAYVQQNLRIPRRGEIGYTGDDIESYEKQGYVMSGSRHARMNAVRIRKENQVYSAEEQRALALITMEENQQKEAQLMQEFRTMLAEKKKLRERNNQINST